MVCPQCLATKLLRSLLPSLYQTPLEKWRCSHCAPLQGPTSRPFNMLMRRSNVYWPQIAASFKAQLGKVLERLKGMDAGVLGD